MIVRNLGYVNNWCGGREVVHRPVGLKKSAR
jgi:hypothetical protein